MFLVGGSILVHGFPGLGSFLASLSAGVNGVAAVLVTLLLEGLAGVLAGALALVLVLALRRLRRPKR
jgi:predicted DNA repair protein MutK